MESSLTIRISRKLKQKLLAVSKAHHIPISDLVRSSIEGMVAVRQFRTLRGEILPHAEAQGILTDEDVFDKLQ
ncbi:MAG: hypothetical protein A3G87_07200 [Omnitrophica bacterium RIFCSPLOWO2_12_FULL_50_11]|nr:MAG: hypothetical protein A3G87_07200 [Omnitrophica bacterium RIFCSPLOWO2_12_FULL_50_11]